MSCCRDQLHPQGLGIAPVKRLLLILWHPSGHYPKPHFLKRNGIILWEFSIINPIEWWRDKRHPVISWYWGSDWNLLFSSGILRLDQVWGSGILFALGSQIPAGVFAAISWFFREAVLVEKFWWKFCILWKIPVDFSSLSLDHPNLKELFLKLSHF